MNEMPGTGVPPVTPMSSGPKPFFQVWIDALTKPSEQNFIEIANSPAAKATTAYTWIFIGYLVQFFFTSLVGNPSLRNMLNRSGSGFQSGPFDGFVGRAVIAVCGAPIVALIATLFFIIFIYIFQWIARMFGGKGTTDQLAYAFAAISAPFLIISGVVSLLSAIPFVGLCFSVILGIAGIYVFVLNIIAMKAVNQFGYGAAIGTLLIPSLVIGFICGCLVFAGMLALGPAIGNAFSTINQSLAP